MKPKKWLLILWQFIIIIIIICILIHGLSADAQEILWERISTVNIALSQWHRFIISPLNPQVMFIANDYALYISNNAGYDWQKIPLPSDRIGTFTISSENPTALYITANLGIYRSYDNGQSWEKLLESNFWTQTLAIHPRMPDIIYAGGGRFSGIMGLDPGQAECYISIDGGKTWRSSLLPDNTPVRWLAPHPVDENIVYAVTYDSFHGQIFGNVFRSNDQGVTWQQVVNDSRGPLLIHPEQPDRMFTIHSSWNRFDGIWFEFSIDAGQNWARGLGMQDQAVSLIAMGTKPDVLYAVAGNGIYYSLNDGLNWRLLSNQFDFWSVCAITTNSDRWTIDGREICGLLLLHNSGSIYRLKVANSSHSVNPKWKYIQAWGEIKQNAQ